MILLVEDDSNARALFLRILSRVGYEVMESEDGVQALRLLEMYPCDLMITDLRMPKMDGFTLISHVRLKWPRLPIILVSGYISSGETEDHREELVEIIRKPVDRVHLLATVNRFVPMAR